jgi:MFS transporter, MHS family, proline/betaine transporter
MRKVLIAGMLANGLEWYDYALYAFMTLTISKLFFPAGNEEVHLLATFGIFAVGFVARPFGAIFFGMLGDRLGRRVALAASILMMAIPTACIGLLPTYASIGLWAPVLLTVIRVLQGLSLGGAFSCSMAYLVEHSPPNRRGLMGSASIASLAIGFMLGALVVFGIKSGMDLATFEDYGWRIPFLLGILVGFVGFFIRHHCEESPEYMHAKANNTLSTTPLRDLWHSHRGVMVQAIVVYITVTLPFYTLSSYLVAFSERSLGLSKEHSLICSSVGMLVLMLFAPVSGWLSDRIGRVKVLQMGAFGFVLLAYPIFSLLMQSDFASVLAAQIVFAALVGFYTGVVPAWLVEVFPTSVRSTGMALAYNAAAVIFGGTAPMVGEWLLKTTGDVRSIALYIMCAAFSTLVALGWRGNKINS